MYIYTRGRWAFGIPRSPTVYQARISVPESVIIPSSGLSSSRLPLPPFPLPSASRSPLTSSSPFTGYSPVMETFLSRRTHYRYLRPADHHHQLIPYRRRSSTAVPFFLFLKKRRRHSSRFPALLRVLIVCDRNRE